MTNSSRAHVLCLRPKADFTKVGIEPPLSLDITYVKPDAPEVGSLIARSRAVVIPAVGPILEPQLFADSPVELVQVTGAGMDRLDVTEMKRLGIAVANIPGGSNEAVAEYGLIWVICTSSSHRTVRGIRWPWWSNSCVIPAFTANVPVRNVAVDPEVAVDPVVAVDSDSDVDGAELPALNRRFSRSFL